MSNKVAQSETDEMPMQTGQLQYPYQWCYHLEAPAKINLWLDITGVREDGYHLLSTVMQTIDFTDLLQVRVGTTDATLFTRLSAEEKIPKTTPPERFSFDLAQVRAGQIAQIGNITLSAAPGLCSASTRLDCSLTDNLLVKAALNYLNFAKKADVPRLTEGHHFIWLDLVKRIPAQAGLGGGSADAAAVLRVLAHFLAWDQIENSRAELIDIAASIGADVPFGLVGGTVHCTGIGEIMDPLPALDSFPILLAKPPVSVATAAAFRAWRQAVSDGQQAFDRPSIEMGLQAVAAQNYRDLD
ncbi:MAG TPA: hypothetical protein GX717_05500, partial [Clostridiaceae bacterium]|nr:hypothetical protein [Clostridiaceae bacterium]